MKCPECQGVDYKSEGWFVRHMASDHNWTELRAGVWWNAHCPKCSAPIVNDQFCLVCKHLFKREEK